jgi:hypothetical protein
MVAGAEAAIIVNGRAGSRRFPAQALVICAVYALLSLSSCRVLQSFELIITELGLPLPRITGLILSAHHGHLDSALFAVCLLCGASSMYVNGLIAGRVAAVALSMASLPLTALVVFAMSLPLIVNIEQL